MWNSCYLKFIGISMTALLVGLVFSPRALANQVGHDTQTFHPTAGEQDYTTVQSTKVLPTRAMGVGLFFDHAQNTLPYGKDVDSKQQNYVTGMDLVFSYGISKSFEVGLALPFNIYQDVESNETHSEFLKNGNTELRPYGKMVLLDTYPVSLAALLHVGYNRMGSNPYTGSGSGLSLSTELALEYLITGSLRLSANIGYRWQDQGNPEDESIVDPIGNRILFSSGLGFDLTKKHDLVAEIYGASAISKYENTTDRSDTNTELLAAWQWEFRKKTKSQFGVTHSPSQGLSAPDLRVFAGVHHIMMPKIKKIAKKIKKKKRKKQPVVAVKKIRKKMHVRKTRPAPRQRKVIVQEPKQITVAEIPLRKPDKIITLKNINFEFDRDDQILKGGIDELKKVAAYLKELDYDQVIIEGHTDYYGSHTYNAQLSHRRSQNIARHLVLKEGLIGSRVKFIGRGELQPKTKDISNLGRAINRRVEIKIYQAGSLLISSD